jgi:hypothetical protein
MSVKKKWDLFGKLFLLLGICILVIDVIRQRSVLDVYGSVKYVIPYVTAIAFILIGVMFLYQKRKLK